jgi:hypothetical protein
VIYCPQYIVVIRGYTMTQIRTINAEQLPKEMSRDRVEWNLEEDDGAILAVLLQRDSEGEYWTVERIDWDEEVQDWVAIEHGIEITATMKAYLLKGIGR